MKKFTFTFTFFLLFSLFLFMKNNYARKLPEDYWKSMMKEQPIPEAIRDLIIQDQATANKMNHFVKDFDTKSIAVIYRSHGDDHLNKNDELKQEKSFVEHSSKAGMEVPSGIIDNREDIYN